MWLWAALVRGQDPGRQRRRSGGAEQQDKHLPSAPPRLDQPSLPSLPGSPERPGGLAVSSPIQPLEGLPHCARLLSPTARRRSPDLGNGLCVPFYT